MIDFMVTLRRTGWLMVLAVLTASCGAWGAESLVLSNDLVTYRWAAPAQGGGLLGVEAGVQDARLLQPGSAGAPWWRVKLKDDSTIANTDLACTVKRRDNTLTFTWRGDVQVVVEARLADDALLRSRIIVDAVKEGAGLREVVFPVVEGIRPLAGAVNDRVLYAFRSGYTRPSPVATGEALNMRYCISYYMQFTALLGGGRGIYIGEHDGTAAWKDMSWTPDVEAKTLSYAVSHPVLDWGGDAPVRHYELPGDCVLGPFQGDWYDAARIYRGWAITAPWCAKGPMHQREDTPKWFLENDYWAVGHISDKDGIRREFVKRELFDFPNTITHDYGYYAQPYQHDLDPEYFPPRPGSANYQRVLGELRERGARVVPYVMGWMWNAASEDYQRRGAKEKGAMLGEDRESVLWAELSPAEECIAMCPASQIWRDKLTEVSMEFVKRYRNGGVYFDYFSLHMNDCHNPAHGHALGGGDYWSRSVNGLFKQVRETVHKVDPEAIFGGEDAAEFCIDVLDAHYEMSYFSDAPIWQAVYHDYTRLFGGMHWQEEKPLFLGRQWLYGHMNQLSGSVGYATERTKASAWYGTLLSCHHDFARPYLGYGEMLRPPAISGEVPTLTDKSPYGPFTARAVEGTAWLAPDGSVGIFFLNYQEAGHTFTWETDLGEIAGLDATKRLEVTQWTEGEGETPMGQMDGGVVGDTVEIPPLGLVALKLEVVP